MRDTEREREEENIWLTPIKTTHKKQQKQKYTKRKRLKFKFDKIVIFFFLVLFTIQFDVTRQRKNCKQSNRTVCRY